jgi:ABC-type phosphonate transport system ATPase subunit
LGDQLLIKVAILGRLDHTNQGFARQFGDQGRRRRVNAGDNIGIA